MSKENPVGKRPTPAKGIMSNPNGKLLASKRLVDGVKADGRASEPKTKPISNPSTTGTIVPYSNSEDRSVVRMETTVHPDSPVVVSSAEEDHEATEDEEDPDSQDMDTQEPQFTGGETMPPKSMPMEVKEEGLNTTPPKNTSSQRKEMKQTPPQTALTRHNPQLQRGKRPPKYLCKGCLRVQLPPMLAK